MMPTGKPLTFPQGTVNAGWPLTSNGQVFCCMLRAASTYTSRGASGDGISVAGKGIVGIASTSQFANALS